MANEPRRIKHILEDVTDVIDECSEWEQSFIRSIEEQFRKKNELTDAQYDKLEQIWEKKCQ